MSGRQTTQGRVVMAIMAVAFAAMLVTSLVKRFSQPDLTVNRLAMQGGAPASQAEGGHMEAIGLLMQKTAENPQDKETVLRLVESLMAIGQWESAENFAQKALSLEGPGSQDPRPLYLLALIHHNRGQHAQAAELLEELVTKTENAPARYSLGILYLHFLNDPQRGIEHLQKGIQDEAAPKSLRDAMREELEKAAGFDAKIGAVSAEGQEKQPEGENGDTETGVAESSADMAGPAPAYEPQKQMDPGQAQE